MKRIYLDTGFTQNARKFESFEVESAFVQVYINAYNVLLKIKTPVAIHLLLWAIHNMTDYNQIVLNKGNRAEFIASCIVSGGKRYKDSTVKSAIRELQKVDAMVSMNENNKRESIYMMNPSYFWRFGDQKDRVTAIKGYRYQLKEIKNEETD